MLQKLNKKQSLQHNNIERIFIIGASPKANKKLTRVMKNFLHINRQTIELSGAKADEVTKPTKITPLKIDMI